MKRVLFLIACLSSILFAQQPSSSQGDEQRILALENIWNQAQMNHDATAMGSMLHPDFVFTDYDGTAMMKPQFLAAIGDSSNTLFVEAASLRRYCRCDRRHTRKRKTKRKKLPTLRTLHGHLDKAQ